MKTSNYYRYLLLLLLLSLTGAKTYAYDIAVNNAYGVTIYYNYINDGTELEVTSGTYIGVVNIPNEVTYMNRTRTVTAIGDMAFSGRTSVTNVTIPNSVTSIGKQAFSGCSKISSIVIPNSVTSIGDNAFSYCSKLTSVIIGNSVTTIGGYAFWSCSSLTSVIFGKSVTTVGKQAFNGCSSLQKVIINDLATWCGITFSSNDSNPLYNANHLYSDDYTEITDLVIPSSVTTIGDYAFYNCTGLTSVTIPNSVTSIGRNAFVCSGLQKVVVNDIAAWCEISFFSSGSNPLNYAYHLYGDDNTEITDLVIPNSVTTIGDYAFYNCTGLTSVTIPNSVTSIGDDAFKGCSGLQKVIVNDIAAWCGIAFNGDYSNPLYSAHYLYSDDYTEITDLIIPNSVTSIGDYAFSGYSKLSSVHIPNTMVSIGNYTFYNCSGLTSVTIPNSVTSIGNATFKNCSGLSSITIPNSVTIIGDRAFENCTGFTSVISKMENPCTISSDCFPQDVFYNVTLYVPYGTTDIYKSTNYWNKFLFIEEDVSGILQVPNIQKNIISQDGLISISGVTEGQQIAIYQADGKQVATAKAYNGSANVATNISKGTPVIVKIGDKAVKVMMR